jgi:ribonuclease HI
MTDKIIVFTDGSCLNNGKKNSIGAIGIFFSDDDPDNLGQVIDNDGIKITNNTMELLSCIQALKIIDDKILNGKSEAKIIYIYTDSTYIINAITKWYSGWVKNGWVTSKGKEVENKELINLLYNLKSKYIVIFKHIRSHQNEPKNKNTDLYNIWYGNYMADKYATESSKQFLKDNFKKSDTNEINITVKKTNIKKKFTNSLNI